ncbi:hypothetical protein BU24DRAFT_416566 [Aaosphaeria arxii CBS 175.79]|uniref:Uncharacterized protein n=1 Tax=Aaosphaeria arxii CBS 175.79 TaxID=1450172 RepID=A0A6A5Y8K6_9PLEO|nr:uncharacterized protein BU24DRAFT_416566 [Aaosphaeria arxii CBS 175.79]KAF2020904.1 hypothetical protein BU24DRAFT_416566 [Aaosphaeria arxii CBS 175.79]
MSTTTITLSASIISLDYRYCCHNQCDDAAISTIPRRCSGMSQMVRQSVIDAPLDHHHTWGLATGSSRRAWTTGSKRISYPTHPCEVADYIESKLLVAFQQLHTTCNGSETTSFVEVGKAPKNRYTRLSSPGDVVHHGLVQGASRHDDKPVDVAQ